MRRAARVRSGRAAGRRRVIVGTVPRRAPLVAVVPVPVVPAAVVHPPPVPVTQHLVSGADLLELDGVAALPIWMVLLGETEIGSLDVLGGGAWCHTQHIIKIWFC